MKSQELSIRQANCLLAHAKGEQAGLSVTINSLVARGLLVYANGKHELTAGGWALLGIDKPQVEETEEPRPVEIKQATMACSICGAHKLASELAEVQSGQWACKANCDARLYASRNVSVIPHVKAEEFNLMKQADGCDGRPDVPATARQFFNCYAYQEPVIIYCWQWSVTFGSWSALVLFDDGWYGWTYPKR